MPKQIFQRPSPPKLGNPGKGGKFNGQQQWGRKKGKVPKPVGSKPQESTAKPDNK